jgi:hypothetical protein
MRDNLRTILALFERGDTETGIEQLRAACETDDDERTIIDLADKEWAQDNLVVDHDAVVSRSGEHAWVSAWVCVDLPKHLCTDED